LTTPAVAQATDHLRGEAMRLFDAGVNVTKWQGSYKAA
jgi:hypothetical protein